MTQLLDYLKKTQDYLFPKRFLTVNCWFCNEDTDIDIQEGESEKRWYCSHCESLNMKDENGDILDPVVPSDILEPPYKVTTYRPYYTNKTKPILCDYCNNEQWIIQWLEKPFDLEDNENETNYNEQVKRYLERKRYLDERYGLCAECYNKVSAYLIEQDELYGKARCMEPILDETEDRSAEEDKYTVRESYRKRSKTRTSIQATFWFMAHLLTLAYFYFAHHYPYALKYNLSLPSDLLMNIFSFLSKSWQDKLQAVSSLETLVGNYYNDFKGILYCFVIEEDDTCHTLSLTNGGEELFLFHLMSYYGITWHIVLYPWFNETRRFHYWKFYSTLQHILFIFRTCIFIYPGIIRSIPLEAKYCAIVYSLVI
ncbi:unnamed protein product [Rhizopus stolonifer]